MTEKCLDIALLILQPVLRARHFFVVQLLFFLGAMLGCFRLTYDILLLLHVYNKDYAEVYVHHYISGVLGTFPQVYIKSDR